MIKNIFVLLIGVILMAQPAFAGGHSKCDGCPMKHKLIRGAEGIVTAPVEYVNQYAVLRDQHGVATSSVGALFAGTAMTAKRVINGVYDVLTFPIKVPNDYGLLLPDDSETALSSYKHDHGKCNKK